MIGKFILYMAISAIGFVVSFYATFFLSTNKNKGYGITSRVLHDVLDALWIVDYPSDRSYKAILLVIGVALILLGFYFNIQLLLPLFNPYHNSNG